MKRKTPSKSYELTPSAEQDLREIARYTLKEWGEKQMLEYGNKLEQCFEELAHRKYQPRPFSTRFPSVFFASCEYHYIFYLTPKNKAPVVIAVLHKQMDMLTMLTKRLAAK